MMATPPFSTMRDVLRQRRPLVIGLLAAAGAVTWFLFRGDSPEAASRAAAEPDAGARTVADSVVRLDSTAQRLAGVEVVTASSDATSGLVANGVITYDANRVSIIAPRVDALVTSVRIDLGHSVRSGTVLATLESSEVGGLRGDLERARTRVDVAQRNYEREKRLFEEQITPQKELLEAEGAFKTAQADFASAEARLRAVGAADGSGATFGLSTPVSGTVVERNASPGQSVGPATTLFTVADLSRVWITVDVYEGDLSRIRQGVRAVVVPTAYANESFAGRVTYAGGVVDSASHTFKVRVEVLNPTGRLRPGMFAQVRMETAAQGGRGAIVVPEIAVQDINGKPVVFVAQPEAGVYVARAIVVGPRAGSGYVVVASGLRAGERIVTRGAFQLKAEFTKASFSGEE